jgi:hypothetical protein
MTKMERCQACGLWKTDDLRINGCPHGRENCPMTRRERASTRMVQTLLLAASLAAVAWLALLLLTSRARASECYSIRDQSSRQACLAEERGAPEDCLGVRDPDARTLCRQRATQEKRFKDLERLRDR